jgi:hypothetical protein
MSRADQTVQAIQGQARLERQAFARSLGEISERLRPQYLVNQGKLLLKRRAGRMLADVSRTVKANGGIAALAGTGAIVAYDIGRKSAGQPTQASTEGSDNRGVNEVTRSEKPTSISTKARAVTIGGAGLLLGHVLSKGVAITDVESRLLKECSSRFQRVSVEFVEEHSRGAKIAAAQTFGFARFAAAFLAVMAAVGIEFDGDADSNQRIGELD